MAFKNLNPAEFDMLIQTGNYTLIDVRSEEEYMEGMIEGHRLIDFRAPNFQNEIGKLPKDDGYLIYCRSGNRSGQTCQLMEQMGFSGELVNLAGGIQAWNEYQLGR